MALAGWKRWAAVAATFFVVFPVLALGIAYAVVHNRDPIQLSASTLVGPSLAAALVAVVLGARLAWARRQRVELDEGGVRIRGIRSHRYLPFASIIDARIRRSFGGAILEIVTNDGKTEQFALPADNHTAFETLIRRIGARGGEATAAAPFGRAEESFDDWVAKLRGAAARAAEAGYRRAAVDHDGLLAAVRNATTPADVRAGAAFLSAAAGSADDQLALAAALRAEPPPIMLVMAALGARTASLVDAEQLAAALSYLDPHDRAAAGALLHGRMHGRARFESALASPPEEGPEQEAEPELEASARARSSAPRIGG